MIVYVSPPGWGKTRIIQEFYRSLAAAQPAPAYWPPTIATSRSGPALTASRKAIRPELPDPPPRRPDWLWLAVASGRLSDKSPAPALPALIEQITAHWDTTPDRHLDGPAAAAALARWDIPTVIVLDDAHDLDQPTVEFVEEVFAARCPVLFTATTWPAPYPVRTPFHRFLNQSHSHITKVELAKLDREDLAEFVRWAHPRTDWHTAHLLADRADGNPYALRLMLDTPRVMAATRDGRITIEPNEITELSSTLGNLLTEHWEHLTAGERRVLCAAALLGETLPTDVLEECLRTVAPESGLREAVESGWLHNVDGSARVLEFTERIRHEQALSEVPNVFARTQREELEHAALRAVKALLRADEGDLPVRNALMSLHMTLAESGVEQDLASAATSAIELATRARHEHRRPDTIHYLTAAIDWLSRSTPTPWSRLADCYLELSAASRTENGRASGEASAMKALEIADTRLPSTSDLRIRARCALAMSRLRRDDLAVYTSGRDLLHECADLAPKCTMSPIAHRDLLNARHFAAAQEGDYPGALVVLRELVDHCEDHLGRTHHLTLDALETQGYIALRAGDVAQSLEMRREVLARRSALMASAGRLQVAASSNNLAATLLESGDDAVLPEAERLATSALEYWAAAYGPGGLRPQRARLVLAWLQQRRGLIAEREGDHDRAHRHFQDAVATTARVVELRVDGEPPDRANALLRHGLSLACLYRIESVAALGKALAIRQDELRQHTRFHEVRRCAAALHWSYQRLGRPTEAAAVRGRFKLPQDLSEMRFILGRADSTPLRPTRD